MISPTRDESAKEEGTRESSGKESVIVRGVRKVYRRDAEELVVLDGIDLTVLEGEFVALMGPSGSGKTTLLNLIAGIDTPTEGEVVVAGTFLNELSEGSLARWRSRNVGFIFQFYNLIPVLTAVENVELPLLLTTLSKKERRERALTALRLLLIGQFELFPDEAYYFMWSERMDWSFFSKGPGVAAAIWLGTHLFGVSEFGIRVLSPLLAFGTSSILWLLGRRLYYDSIALWTVLLVNLLPIFTVGSVIMTIDPLSIFFWTAALYTSWRALEESPEFSRWWPATGVLM